MAILTKIRNDIIIAVADAIENRIDGREIIKDRIRPTVKNLLKTDRATDKMLKGPLADLLKELYEGIYGRSTCASLERWQHELNTRA